MENYWVEIEFPEDARLLEVQELPLDLCQEVCRLSREVTSCAVLDVQSDVTFVECWGVDFGTDCPH